MHDYMYLQVFSQISSFIGCPCLKSPGFKPFQVERSAIDCVTSSKIALCNIDSPSTGLFASILFDCWHVNKLKENNNG